MLGYLSVILLTYRNHLFLFEGNCGGSLLRWLALTGDRRDYGIVTHF